MITLALGKLKLPLFFLPFAILITGCTTPYVTDSGRTAGTIACMFASDPILNALGDAKVATLAEEGEIAKAAALSTAMAAGRLQRDEICASLNTPVSGVF